MASVLMFVLSILRFGYLFYTRDSTSLKLPDIAKKNVVCTVKFELQIRSIFGYKYVPCNSWVYVL